MMNLTREQRFVLSSVRSAFGYPSNDNIDPATKLDWQAIEQITKYNGVSSILHSYFKDSVTAGIPAGYRDSLIAEYMGNVVTGMLLQKALQELADVFVSNDIAFVVHKGVALSALVYPTVDLRPPGTDIDILIRKADYERARSILVEIGYESESPELEKHEATYIGEVHFFKTMGTQEIVIDLHTDFNPNHWGKVSGFDMGNFWGNLLEVNRDGLSVPHLPVEPCLFFLAIHCAANHVFDRLILFCDIDLLIRKFGDEIDWGQVGARVKKHHCRKTLYHCLDCCRQLLDTPVPGEFLADISPGSLSISMVRRRSLLMKKQKPPKWLERYMHIVLLDNPLLFFKSMFIFAKRILSGLFLRRG